MFVYIGIYYILGQAKEHRGNSALFKEVRKKMKGGVKNPLEDTVGIEPTTLTLTA